MTSQRLVSVVIPTYNRAAMLLEAIDSVLTQSCHYLELVIVDDGSTDDTLERLSEISDPRLTVVKGSHSGASSARNLGVKAAKGDLIAFLDSDDLFMCHKLEACLKLFEQDPDVVMVYSHWRQDNLLTGAVLHLKPTAVGDIRHDLLMCSLIVVPTVVMDKKVFERAGGFTPDMKIAEDYDLWCRVSSFGKVDLVPDELSIIRLHKGNTFMEASESLRCRLQVVEHFFSGYNSEGLEPKRVYRAKAYYDVNYLYLAQHRYFAWFFVLLTAMILDGKRHGAVVKYILKDRLRAFMSRHK